MAKKRAAVSNTGVGAEGKAATARPVRTNAEPPRPAKRRLQVYSIDPSVDSSLDTAAISRSVISVRWEKLLPGPVGEYVEVVDVDPSSGCYYEPIDLDHPHTLASDGIAPSEGSPQFHQQMVYAVVMKTVENFERALGRRILWAERMKDEQGEYLPNNKRYVRRLRVYPHALREANAYYSPSKKALLFGYFNAPTTDPREELPGGLVFTCLSHDIIAHETTHAILDGIHRRLLDPTNEDMLAFHEAFADIVAIFQHFTIPGLLLDQMQATRGELAMDNFLATLAVQFGRSTKRGNALRNALGRFDDQGRRTPPDPEELGRTDSPHARGAILVAAVFDAFLRIYESRVKDLRRIATGGTGKLPDGEIHPDLARRFADEALKSAQQVLTIAIRALDYVPPVDLTFGDYLRAIITADTEIYPDDTKRYRVAFIEAFRNRGIFPRDVRALGEESLRWNSVQPYQWETLRSVMPPPEVLRTMVASWEFFQVQEFTEKTTLGMIRKMNQDNPNGLRELFLKAYWNPHDDRPPATETFDEDEKVRIRRENIFLTEQQFRMFLYYWLVVTTWTGKPEFQGKVANEVMGLDFKAFADYLNEEEKDGAIEVHAVRPTYRVQPDGRTKVELLVTLTQRVQCYLPAEPRLLPDTDDIDRGDKKTAARTPDGRPVRYWFRGGATLLLDPETGVIRYAISKNIRANKRRERVEAFLRGRLADLGNTALDRYALNANEPGKHAPPPRLRAAEPLALLHDDAEGAW